MPIKLSRQLPLVCALLSAALVCNLFWLGTKPVAVGLIPEPWDKLAHVVTFGVLAALWCGVFRAQRPWRTLTIVILIGACDEIHQLWLPGRSADIADFLADIAGAGLVVAAICIHTKLRDMRGP